MNFNTTIQQLKNTMKVAQHTGKEESFSAKKTNSDRDIFCQVFFNPKTDIKEDVYPHWHINMKEENLSQRIYFKGNDLKGVKEAFNSFMSQGIGESYLEKNMYPY